MFDKFDSVLLIHLAYIELKDKNSKKAESCLKKAINKAKLFDANPDYDAKNLRHIHLDESLMLNDALGKICMDAIEATVSSLKLPEVTCSLLS